MLYRKLADFLIRNYDYSEDNFFWIISDRRDLQKINSSNYIVLSYTSRKNKSEMYDLKINEIIASDRLLCKNKKKAKNHLLNLEIILNDFIVSNSIQLIIGERANAHELLLGRICNANLDLKCHYISITDIRIPSRHFAFFEDEKETKLIEMDNENDEPFKLEKPSYLFLNDNLNKFTSYLHGNRIARILSNIRNISKKNIVGFRTFLQYINTTLLSRDLNKLIYKLLVRKENFENYANKNYIFYGFHKQPESSIDVCGRYSENQYLNIYNLWRLLPKDWLLIVKEHTNAIGDRNIFLYNKIKKLPGVILVKETTDSYSIMKNAKLTISVTGTISLEAALMGKISITLAKTFFNRLNNCLYCSFQDMEEIGLNKLASYNYEDNIEQYKQYIMRNSFNASVLDYYADSNSLDEKNIEIIGNALYRLVKKISL